ncbi:hypothetical protein GCM10010266_68660 [Streptomyces griseomycini]|nr:hypothetical protein GCM10010266_68660 [Streptomyces griseomycini]GGR60011.1 hypothetical protein GCM10015536_75230 [Streptomyces griseomycini]
MWWVRSVHRPVKVGPGLRAPDGSAAEADAGRGEDHAGPGAMERAVGSVGGRLGTRAVRVRVGFAAHARTSVTLIVLVDGGKARAGHGWRAARPEAGRPAG